MTDPDDADVSGYAWDLGDLGPAEREHLLEELGEDLEGEGVRLVTDPEEAAADLAPEGGPSGSGPGPGLGEIAGIPPETLLVAIESSLLLIEGGKLAMHGRDRLSGVVDRVSTRVGTRPTEADPAERLDADQPTE